MAEPSSVQSDRESQDVFQLILSLKSRFLKEDFERIARILISREETLEAEKLRLKEELEGSRSKFTVLEEQNGFLKDRISGLSDDVRKMEEKLAEFGKGRILKRKANSLDVVVAIHDSDCEEEANLSSNSRGFSANSQESHSGDRTPLKQLEKSGQFEKCTSSSFTKVSEPSFSKIKEFNWQNEADMLSNLIEDTNLCLEAVCVLYRLEISQVKLGTKRLQGPKHRGLFGNDVLRGTKMAEFLTKGDPFGPVKRTIEELNEYDELGMMYCLKLIQIYSRHLFEVYKNKEDPYFR